MSKYISTAEAAEIIGCHRSFLDSIGDAASAALPNACIRISMSERVRQFRWDPEQLGAAINAGRMKLNANTPDPQAKPKKQKGRRQGAGLTRKEQGKPSLLSIAKKVRGGSL